MTIKVKTFEILEKETTSSHHNFQIFISILIFLNVISVMLETVESLGSKYQIWFNTFEWVSVSIFALEYIARAWVCDLKKYSTLTYLLSPMAIIDLLSFLPSLISVTGVDLRSLRILRLLRLLKLSRYSKAFQHLSNAIKAARDELFLSLLLMIVLLVISCTLIYFAEHDLQPKAFSSIPASLWWGVITLTTIGYGDIYPITLIGKTIAGLTALFGIGLFALPGGIIASELIASAKKRKSDNCPHCGK